MNNSSLKIETFVDQSFGENAYVLSSPDQTGRQVGWVIDPGFPPQVDDLLRYVQDERITVERIVLTHGHADHIVGLDVAHDAHPQAEVLLSGPDQPMLSDAMLNLSAPFGFRVVLRTKATGDLSPGMQLMLGELNWQVLDTSGHSPGGRSLYCAGAGVVFAGDALFSGSIGRTDFPGSDHHRLISNIRNHLLSLPGATVVYSGHGPVTTIEKEQKFNPFLSD